jgi:hypothetical protein
VCDPRIPAISSTLALDPVPFPLPFALYCIEKTVKHAICCALCD